LAVSLCVWEGNRRFSCMLETTLVLIVSKSSIHFAIEWRGRTNFFCCGLTKDVGWQNAMLLLWRSCQLTNRGRPLSSQDAVSILWRHCCIGLATSIHGASQHRDIDQSALRPLCG